MKRLNKILKHNKNIYQRLNFLNEEKTNILNEEISQYKSIRNEILWTLGVDCQGGGDYIVSREKLKEIIQKR